MIKTPVIFTVEEFIEESVDPTIPIPVGTLQTPLTSDNILDLVTQPIKLAPRYYLKIKPPTSIRNDTEYIPRTFVYNIPWEGIYKNQIRVGLQPTVGWGEGSCYIVEYWEWQPMIFPKSYKRPPLRHRLLKTEYWLIPHPSNRYLVNYQYLNLSRSFKSLSLSLTSTGAPISLLDHPDIHVLYIVTSPTVNPVTYSISNTTTVDTTLTEHALIQAAINYKNTTDTLLTTNVPLGQVFTLNYVKPVDIKQILFKNSLFPQNIYINNSSFLQNTVSSF
jgi:hypothetical protein